MAEKKPLWSGHGYLGRDGDGNQDRVETVRRGHASPVHLLAGWQGGRQAGINCQPNLAVMDPWIVLRVNEFHSGD